MSPLLPALAFGFAALIFINKPTQVAQSARSTVQKSNRRHHSFARHGERQDSADALPLCFPVSEGHISAEPLH
jgi:hypothetical protein